MRAHTKLRLAQRYGLDVTSTDIFQMAKRMAHGQATLLSRQSKTVALWQLEHQGQLIRMVFDSRSRSILTALPLEDSVGFVAAKQLRNSPTTCKTN